MSFAKLIMSLKLFGRTITFVHQYNRIKYYENFYPFGRLVTMKKEIIKYSFKEGLPQEFEIVDLAQLYQNFAAEMTVPHRTGFYHVLWFQNGGYSHLVDFNPVEIKPNTLLFMDKNVVQRFDAQGNIKGKAILFTDSFFCKTEADIRFLKSTILFNDLLSISQVQLPNQTTSIHALFEQMETEMQTDNDTHQSDILRNSLRNLLLYSERERQKQGYIKVEKGADLNYVMQFKELLEANYHERLLVSDYAHQMSITIKRLNQATSKVLGLTPKRMIDTRTLLEAKRVLAHTHKTIKEVGFDLGFNEPTNFIKYFKKHVGSTPVAFRAEFTRS